MSKHKNFKINRTDNNDSYVLASLVSIGDMFEREGTIHMRVSNCHGNTCKPSQITICNLNTGSVWNVSIDENYRRIKDCTLTYSLKPNG